MGTRNIRWARRSFLVQKVTKNFKFKSCNYTINRKKIEKSNRKIKFLIIINSKHYYSKSHIGGAGETMIAKFDKNITIKMVDTGVKG